MSIPPCRRNLVVITNSVRVAGLFMERSTARVLVPGGCRPVIVYGLFTSSKETGLGLHSFAETAEITALYTDDEISSDFVDDWRARKVAVQVVPAFDRFARPGISVNGRARILSAG